MSERDTKPVHVRDVPAEVVDILQARAGARGMSLTAYLRNHLVEMANRPTMEEWTQAATDRGWGVDGETIQRTIREIREEDA
ncbi:FitA-like ribbon-helix-helix domain-containing protein [Actinosynnema sp. CA-299493]